MQNNLDPQRVMESLRDGTIDAVKSLFPIEGKKNVLVVNKVYSDPIKDVDDIVAQRKAKVSNRTWALKLYGDFELRDKETGKLLDKKSKVSLMSLPQITRRYSYIVKGNEYQVDKQWRLKSGVYTRKRADGDLETQFNLAKGRGFRMRFIPEKKNFVLQYGTSNLPLSHALKALGATDEEIEATWGKEIAAAAKKGKEDSSIMRLAKALSPFTEHKDTDSAKKAISDAYEQTQLLPETTKITLGESYDKVSKASLLAASKKLLRVHRGEDEVDNRDSLQFKELWSIDDHIPERITNSKKVITRKLQNNVDRKSSVSSIVSSQLFNTPIQAFFTTTALAQQPTQANTLDMVSGNFRTTILGPGAIGNTNAVSLDAKLIDPSHLGFLDPVATPEGEKTGITLHLGLGVSRKGKEAAIPLYDAKTKKVVRMTPPELSGKTIAFSDQYTWSKGTPTPKDKMVTVSSPDEDNPKLVKPSEVDFVLTSPKAMFSMTANMIPFLASDQANRAEMATRHLEQAISLKNRENPLVQVHTGDMKSGETWEGVLGKFTSHQAPVNGKVTSITKDGINIKDAAGKRHTVPLYDHYPLNDKKAMINSTPSVKVGDKVTRGQIVADTSFTKNGVLSLGTNLRVGYLPYKGLVFEDGIVISETASEKLTSEHLYKERSYVEKNQTLGLKKFRANFPGAVSDENAKKLDDDGVIKVGQRVEKGDVITAIMQKSEPSKEQLLLKGIHRSLVRPFKDKSVIWEKDYSGEVTDVVRNGREVTVFIKTEEPADIGDKLSGRHGNKGVITAVVPDDEMPRDKEGEPLQIIYNPSGVPGRINPGQVLETTLAKVADKQGQSYAVNNFEADDTKKIVKVKSHYRTIQTKEGPKRILVKSYEYERGYQEVVKDAMAQAGVEATTELFDPETGKSLGPVLVGQQYTLKLLHQVEKKMTARAHGHGQEYDASMIPKGGGKKGGAQRFGNLGMFAMLAHGSTANIRDAMTYKSDRTQDEVWTAIQTGNLLPSPKPSFAYEKFLAYLNSMGVNVEKEGNGLILSPMTDEQILDVSNGELEAPTRVLRGKDLKPEKGGLFDEEVTGGPGGDKWSHIKLADPIPNPLFEKAIRSLLGLKQKDFNDVMDGDKALNDKGEVVSLEDSDNTGPKAIVDALAGVDVKKDLAQAKKDLTTARKADLDKANKKVKYLEMLERNELSASEAYVLENLPVLPPIFRPITAMEGGDLNIDGINLLYRDLSLINDKLKDAKAVLPDDELAKPRGDLYDALVALMATGAAGSTDAKTLDGRAKPPGVLSLVSGQSGPKTGYFHQKVLDRKQDLGMRSVIVPDLDLHLDEIGIPRKGAMKIFRPFVVREMVRMGYTPLSAREEIEKNSNIANKALDVVVDKRPVLFKRDPVLHKFGIMGFKAKLHDEKSIHIHPLVVGGFNADFDGDTMAVFVPVSQEAVDEAYKMMPSKNLFNPSTGRVMYQPSLEGQLGLFLLTQMGKDSKKKFSSSAEALKAAKAGDISMTDKVTVDGKKTTAGRLAFNKALPSKVQSDKYLTDSAQIMGGKNLQKVLREVAINTPGEFQQTADNLKNLGFSHAYNVGFSFKMSDFDALRGIRDKHIKAARAEVAKIKTTNSDERNKKIISIYDSATKKIQDDAKKSLSKSGSNLFAMYMAGVKPGWSQLQQLIIAPMLLENAKGEVIPVPVTKSYSEGLDSSGYWVASSGARKGLIEKVQSVSKPGALSKQIMNSVLSYVVTDNDCGTTKGVALDATDRDLADRFLAKSVSLKNRNIPAGTLVTPTLASEFKSAKVSKVVVRSPLKCQQPKGMCSTCYGAMDGGNKVNVGTNIGAIAGQSVGERTVQVSMKQFHTGGVAGAGGNVVGALDRVTQLLKMPQKLPNSAALSPLSGKVSSITPSAAGGVDVKIGSASVYIPASRKVVVKKNDSVKKGQILSDGIVNPRELLEKTNIETVQRYLTDELDSVFSSEGVKKRNLEVVVKSLTNLGVVTEGTSEGITRGDYVQLNHAAAINSGAKDKISVEPVLRGIETLALDQTTDWLARLQYRKLKETLIRGANEGWKSDIHGIHPAPGIAYSAELGKSKKPGGPY